MDRILIIQTAFIGDVILATPLIEKLHTFYPNAKIDFLLRKGNEQLLENHPKLNEVLIWNKKDKKYKNLFKILRVIRSKKYDYLINIQRFGASGFLTWLSGARYKIGFNKNPFSWSYSKKIIHEIGNNKHEVERNLELISELTDTSFVRPKLYPTENHFNKVSTYTKSPYVCMAPTSVWFTKQMPTEKWIELINKTTDNVYLLGGPADYKACEKIKDLSNNDKVKNLAGKLTFLDSAALMSKSKMNYVNDSAPMHMSSSVNSPTTVFYCSTVPSFGFGPLSDNSTIIETKINLDCKPCGLHGYKKCPLDHFKCGKTIEI